MSRPFPFWPGCVLAALVTCTAIAPSEARQANSSVPVQTNPGSAQRIAMGIGKSIILDLPQDASEIFVGNPAVANAIVRTARKLYIIGIANGQTTVYALDRQGHQFAAYEISIGRDIGELTQILRTAMPNTDIVARTVNDTIILTGSVDSAEDAQRAADIAKGFAKTISNGPGAAGSDGLVVNSLVIRGRDQVMLKVTIAEMRRDIIKQLGITSASWGPFSQANPFGINGAIGQGTNALTGSNVVSALNIHAGSLSATLQAFERYGVAHTLAEPTVTAVSGEYGKFTVGGQFPYPGPATCGSGGCVSGGAAFMNYGITLNFSPVILSEGRILLHLATEVTDIDYSDSVTISGVSTPGLKTRKNETTVELPSGGSIATAGLLQQQTQQVINGLPGLLNIPILGALFRSRDYMRQETELMIIVTPIIVKATKPGDLARPDDGYTDSTDPQAWLLGRMNRLYATPNNPETVKDYRGHVGFIQD